MQKEKTNSVRLRHFPWPYRAGLAICSDIDDCDRATFVRVHRRLNLPGEGFGLAVSDSFFALGNTPGQLAWFEDADGKKSCDAGFIKDAVDAGLIDCLHSWGDFNNAPPQGETLRRLADKLMGEIAGWRVKPEIWINHGSPNNHQNLQSRLRPSWRGDDPSSPTYTADLARGIGMKYYWSGELTYWPMSPTKGPGLLVRLKRRFENKIKNGVKTITGKSETRRTQASLTELALPVRLRDGLTWIDFTRHNRHPDRLWGLPTRNTLRYNLGGRVLDDLLAQEGRIIVYAHLGLPQPADALFTDQDEAALQRLAQFRDQGLIWVATTAQLLRHFISTRYLNWDVETGPEKNIIRVHSMADPVLGMRSPEIHELAGVCFYTPRPEYTILEINGKMAVADVHPPDHTGCPSIGFKPALAPDTALLEA